MTMINKTWTVWQKMPAPNCCLEIKGPTGPGVYQIRNKLTLEYILFGIGKDCQKRMQSLYPKPYGRGTRNNDTKRKYILQNWQILEYRTLKTSTRKEAEEIERELKALNNHKFNT